MAEFDVVISGGMVVDGTRLPRYRADVGIKDGKIAKIGYLKIAPGQKSDRRRRTDTSCPASSICIPIMMRSFSGIRIARFRAGMA